MNGIFTNAYSFICGLLVTLGVGLLCYAFFGGILKVEGEKRAFHKMIMEPSDASVRDYMKAYKKTCGPLSFVYHIYLPISFYNHAKRRATGWEAIKSNPNVSENVKTELKNLYIAHGVSIK